MTQGPSNHRRARRNSVRGTLAVVFSVLLFAAVGASPALAGNKFSAVSAFASTTLSAANCSTPTLSEPFAGYGDQNKYALVPGQVFDSFDASGWTLSGAASLQSTTLADGTTGPVLDLPSGAQAISPAMCVQSDYPTARAMVRDITGTLGVKVFAAYAGASNPTAAGYLHGPSAKWSASEALQTHPGTQTGWQLVQFTLLAAAASSDTQIYNFFVDPRMSN